MVELGPLVFAHRVLDGQFVQSQLGGELVELVLRRGAEVDPDDGALLGEIPRDVLEGKVLGFQNSVAVEPAVGVVHGDLRAVSLTDRADRRCSHTVGRSSGGPVRVRRGTRLWGMERAAEPPERRLDALVERARALLEAPERRILGIAGAPGSGKTTLARSVATALGPRVGLVPMDGFHLADAALDELAMWKGRIDTFDGWGYLALLRRLRDETTHPVFAPAFERDLEQPIAGSIAIGPGCGLIVTEGNYLLHDVEPWASVRAELDEVWFCDLDDEVRRDRLVDRHVLFGKSPEAAQAWVARVDEPNAVLVRAGRGRADAIARTGP